MANSVTMVDYGHWAKTIMKSYLGSIKMKPITIEQLINTLKEHISLAEKSRWYAEQGDEERSNSFDDEMQEIETYLMETLGMELDSYGIIQPIGGLK